MKRLFGIPAVLMLLAATIVWAQAAARATLRGPAGEREVPVVQQGGETFFAAEETIGFFGGTLTAEGQGFRVAVRGNEAVFGSDSRFAVVRDSLIEMPQAPMSVEGHVYVPWQFFREFLRTAAGLDLSWEPASRSLVATPRAPEVVSAQVSVVDLQGMSKIVIQFSAAAPYNIARSGASYLITLRSPVRAPFADQSYENPRVSRVAFHDNVIQIDLRGENIVGDAYQLQQPFRIVLDLKEGAPAVPGAPQLPRGEVRPQELPGIRTIVLDPGHGGHEVGAIGPNGVQEKDVTLAICRKLAAMISSRLGVRALLTRDADEVVSLDRRTALANQYKADLFLSVHLNASLMKGARGSETYFLSVDASDEQAKKVAERENTINGGAGNSSSDLRLILWDLAQQEYLQESSRFAEIVQDEMTRAVGAGSRGVKQAPFKVLVGATMPAALVEVGFISNPEEEARLTDETFQTTIASTLLNAIQRYKAEYDVRMGVPTPTRAVAPPAPAAPPPAQAQAGKKQD